MRPLTRSLTALAAIVAFGLASATAEEPSADAAPPEIRLTDETLSSLIAATKEMQALEPADSAAADDSEGTTELDDQMDAIAKKHGFGDGDAYVEAYQSAVQAFAAVDWTSESRKKQAADEIAAINADATMSPEAKQEAINLVEADLAQPAPEAMAENVELIRKREAEMRELMSSDIGP